MPDPIDLCAGAALRAGFRGQAAQIAVAVAMAESGGVPKKSHVPGEESYGPWQIHLPSHPEFTREFVMTYDGGAQAAYKISAGGTNWRPWTMFRNGRYRAHMGAAAAALLVAGGPAGAVPPTGGVTGPAFDALDNARKTLGAFVDAVLNPRAWAIRLLEIVGGLIMAAAGTLMISRDLAPNIAKAAAAVPGAAKVAGAAA